MEESYCYYEFQLAQSVGQSLARIHVLLSKYNEEFLCSKYKPLNLSALTFFAMAGGTDRFK